MFIDIIVAPKSISIFQNYMPLFHGETMTVEHNRIEEVGCESRKSNPPSEIQWFLGDEQLYNSVQTNTKDPSDSDRFRSYSTLRYSFSLNDAGKLLTCQVKHALYEDLPKKASLILNILR